jgi:formiminotetrahydrofolate cyclodeaminase
VRFRDMSVQAFSDALASGDATPGGGSAAALAGAMASALVAMVARTTAASRKFVDRAPAMEAVAREADALRADFLALTEEDAAAFDGVMAAFRLPRESAEEQEARSRAIQHAYREAVSPPMKVCDFSLRVLALAARVAEEGTPSAVSDAGVAARLGSTALEGGRLNVRINLGAIKDEAFRATCSDRLRLLTLQGAELAARADHAVDARLH